MKVKEVEQNLATRFEERVGVSPAVTSAVRKLYLESARGHYLSALTGLNAGKQERTNLCHNVDVLSMLENSALEQAAEAEQTHIQGQLGQANAFTEMDVQIHLHNGVLKASDRKLQAMKAQLSKGSDRNTKEQIAELISRIGAAEQEMETIDASELEDSTTALPELGDAKQFPLKGVSEGTTLQKMVRSLKVVLENLKKEHAELKDKDAGAELATSNLHLKLLKTKSESEGCIASEPKVRQTFEGTSQDQLEPEDPKTKGKRLKRENESSRASEEVGKRQRVGCYVDKAKEVTVSNLDESKSVSGKIYDACVSTSESSARMMFSEDELEASSKKAEYSDKLKRGKFTQGQVESATYDHSSEFSIRDYVFAARSKDISMNWPFSQQNLQLCLKRGVKDVLPPFQPIDSLRDSSVKKYLPNTSLQSEENNFDERPIALKNHLVPGIDIDHQWKQDIAEGYRDSDSLPSVGEGEKEVAFKTTVLTNSQSEVESVSTSNLPLSEVSDERGAAASASDYKMKCLASHLSSKKCKVAVKMRISGFRGAADDITSACTASPEATVSKICPVCQSFSSSSNTTLNAHIDQCLSSQSTPNWMKNSKLVKPRIKSRKMRLMADICAMAPRCTLEDLDRRNGTNWATNAEFSSQDTEMINQGKTCRLSSKLVENNGDDDGAVYIDSSGKKIRILSKFNDISSSSLPKAEEVPSQVKQSKLGKTSKFFSPKGKRRLAKHLKYLKVTCQRKRFSTIKVKGRPNKVCGTAESMSIWREKHVNDQQLAPFVKVREQKNSSVSGTSRQRLSTHSSNFSWENVSKDVSSDCKQAYNSLQHGRDCQENERMHVKKQSSSPRKSLSSLRTSARIRTLYQAETDQKSGNSCGRKTLCGPMKGTIQGKRDSFVVPLKLATVQFNGKEGAPKPMNPTSPRSSLEREVEIQGDAVENDDRCFPVRRKLLDSSHVLPFEGIRSHNSETNVLSSSLSHDHASQNSEQKSTAVEESHGCRRDEKGDMWSVDNSPQSGSTPDYLDVNEITGSVGCSRLTKLRQKRKLERGRNGSIDTNKTGGLPDETQDSYGCVGATIAGVHNNMDVSGPVMSSGFAIGETAAKLKEYSDSESEKVDDVRDTHPIPVHYSDKFQGSLIRIEGGTHPSQHGLRDDHEIFHGNVVGAETLELQVGGSDFNVGLESSFPDVDPILIPGPPGSDLPSFSDMGSEDLHRSSSLNSSLAQSSGSGNDVDRDISDSPLSATSTISNLGTTEDPTVLEPECLTDTHPGFKNVYPGLLGASSAPMLGTSKLFSQLSGTDTERVTSPVDSSKDSVWDLSRGPLILKDDTRHCSCSRKEGIPWSSVSNIEESQPVGRRLETMATSTAGKHTGSILNESLHSRNAVLCFSNCPGGISEILADSSETSFEHIMPMEVATEATVSYPRTAVYDSASPAPILRLMGKDLMVINKTNDNNSMGQAVQNICKNSHVLPVSEFPYGVPKSWQHQSTQSMVFIGPRLHEQDRHYFPMQHFDTESSNMVNNFRIPKPVSQGSIYVDKRMHANFPALGVAPPQR